MFEAVCLTILLSTARCGASVVTDGHKENVTPQSSQLGDEKVRMDRTQGSFHHKPSDDQNENSLHSESTPFVPFSNTKRSEIYAPSSSVLTDVLRSNKSITDGSGTEPLQEDIGVKGLVWLRRPRDAENISSSLMARLAAIMKTVGMENNELKADVKELQGTAEKLTTRLLEVEAKSSVVTAQQQQMVTGQLQLQISQLSTKMLKLQNDNEALRAQLQNISEVTSAKSTKLQNENEVLREQLHNISEVTSITTTKLQDENAALRVQLQNISEVTAGLQTQNRSFYGQVRTLTNDNMAQHTQAKAWHTTLLEKVAALQVQASLLDSKLRVHGDELTTVNKTLRTQNTELEDRLNLQISQLRRGDQDLLEKITNYTSTEAVGFYARLSATTATNLNRSLILDRVEYNVGGAYDPKTGVFTVPVTGLYLFLLSMASDTGHFATIYIALDRRELCWAFSPPSRYQEAASCHAATKAVKGQKLWLRSGNPGQVYGGLWTTFTGVLIQREY